MAALQHVARLGAPRAHLFRIPLYDVATATSWWARFGKLASHRRAEELAALAAAGDFVDDGPAEPYRAPVKIGRNEPCACGSGKEVQKEGQAVLRAVTE